MKETVIHSKRTITPEGIKQAFVWIKDGIIQTVSETLPDGYNGAVEDVGDCILMAGVIDPHVHVNEPGRTHWEGFDTATKAAISGGITTLVDMPLNASPVTTTVQAFEEKIASTTNKLHTNCGFWGGLVPGNAGEIEGLIAKGVLGFKAFLTHSGIDEFPNVTEADLRIAMPILAKHHLPLLVHCELSDEDHASVGSSQAYGPYVASRPKQWEDDAITMMIRLCEEFSCRTHIVHLSSADSIQQIVDAKQKGLPLTVETAQHYLYFNAETIKDGQTQFKCAPPIREKDNNDRLWQALMEGIIDFVATDHSPAPPDMKQTESGDFMRAWGGISSVQWALSILWTAAQKRNIGLEKMAIWLSENPAKLIGKEKIKGKIAAGYDADLVVWDDSKSFSITEDIIHHKHKMTPYLNEVLYGEVAQTWLAGERVYEKHDFLYLNKGKLIFAK